MRTRPAALHQLKPPPQAPVTAVTIMASDTITDPGLPSPPPPSSPQEGRDPSFLGTWKQSSNLSKALPVADIMPTHSELVPWCLVGWCWRGSRRGDVWNPAVAFSGLGSAPAVYQAWALHLLPRKSPPASYPVLYFPPSSCTQAPSPTPPPTHTHSTRHLHLPLRPAMHYRMKRHRAELTIGYFT